MPNEFFSLKENRLAFKILNIMNFRVLFIYLQLCLFLQNGYSQESSLVVPVIRLCPEEAITLRTSELFDGYRIFSLNGCSYDRMLDILEVGDQFIALLEIKMEERYIAVFDRYGHFLQRIGNNVDFDKRVGINGIQLEPDGTLGVYVTRAYLNYSLDGKLNFRRKIENSTEMRTTGFSLQGGVGNDLYLWRMYQQQGNKDSDKYWLKITNADGHTVLQFFSLVGREQGEEYSSYTYDGCIRLYNVYDSHVYSVEKNRVIPCYCLDKGKHTTLLDMELLLTDCGKAVQKAGIIHVKLKENQKYVIGEYFFKTRYYYFVHDKSNGKTSNYVFVDDDILFPSSPQSRLFPSTYFQAWSDLYFDDCYFNFYYRPQDFTRKIDRLKEHLSLSGWDEFCRKHPDIIKIYKENDGDAFVIISYKFR